jgi:hypothetical protein
MAGKIVADTLEHSTAGSIATNYVVEGSAKVWLDQNHRTSFGTNDSFNVSVAVDTASGVVDVSFTSNMSSGNYSAPTSGISQYGDTNSAGAHMTVATDSTNRASSGLKTICNDYNNASRLDSERVDLAVFGDLA